MLHKLRCSRTRQPWSLLVQVNPPSMTSSLAAHLVSWLSSEKQQRQLRSSRSA